MLRTVAGGVEEDERGDSGEVTALPDGEVEIILEDEDTEVSTLCRWGDEADVAYDVDIEDSDSDKISNEAEELMVRGLDRAIEEDSANDGKTRSLFSENVSMATLLVI